MYLSGFSRETEDRARDREKARYDRWVVQQRLNELSYAITEARKSHGLPSESWKTRKAGDIIQCEYESQRTERQCPRAGENGYLSSSKEQICPSSTFLFCSGLKGVDDDQPLWGGSSLPSPPIQMLISPGSTFTDTPRNNVLPALWAHFSKLTHKINCHTM